MKEHPLMVLSDCVWRTCSRSLHRNHLTGVSNPYLSGVSNPSCSLH